MIYRSRLLSTIYILGEICIAQVNNLIDICEKKFDQRTKKKKKLVVSFPFGARFESAVILYQKINMTCCRRKSAKRSIQYPSQVI
jgi:hypothetical protein